MFHIVTVGKINLELIVLASIDRTVGATSSGLVSLSSALRADFRPHKFCEIEFNFCVNMNGRMMRSVKRESPYNTG